MTSVDAEVTQDVEETPLADDDDDSCVLQYIEIVPLERTSDVVIKQKDLQDIKQEPADDYDTEQPCFTVQVSSASTNLLILCIIGLRYRMYCN